MLNKIQSFFENKKSPIYVSIIFAVLIVFTITIGFSSCSFVEEDRTVIADNCFIFNPETAEDEIIACDENSMTIKTIYGLTDGSILSVGITSKTPHGALRKIKSIEKTQDAYKVITEQAALCEAIKECKLHCTANVHPDGSYDIVKRDSQSSGSSSANAIIQNAYADGASIGQEFSFDSVLFNGKFGYAINFDADIYWGHVYIKVTGEIYASAALKDFTKIDTGDISLPSPDLPDVEFMAGPLPVVVTNDLSLTCRGLANLKSFKISAGCTLDKEAGFEYCTDWGIKPVNIDRSSGPSMSVYAEKDTFRGTLSANFTATYTGKLYGIAGFSIGAGVVDDFNMHLKRLADWEDANGCIHVPGLNWDLKGRLHNKVYIPISGNFTMGVSIDIFGLKFKTDELNVELFNTNDAITLLDQELTFGNLDDDPDFNAANQIALVLDVSGSMNGKPLEQLKSACTKFVNSINTSKALISVVGFESSAKIYIEDTDDTTSLINTINSLKDLGSTNMEDGLSKAEQILNKSNNTKKSIVLMSDGLPNQGKTDSSLVSYANNIKTNGVTIYTLGFFHDISGSKTTPQKLMEDIASPGFHYEADSPTSLQEFFDQISSQIKGISYYLVEIKCPVNVSVSYNGETMSSTTSAVSQSTSFGSINYADEANSTDKMKILRLKEGPSYDIKINGYGVGKMDYSIGYVNERGQYDDTRYFDNLSVNPNTKIDTKAKLTDTNEMVVDSNGDGKDITKYEASKNEHARVVEDKPNDNLNNNQANNVDEHELGFFEKIIKGIYRFFNDLMSNFWYMFSY